MTRIIELEDNQRCECCDLSIEFCDILFCTISKIDKRYNQTCCEGEDADEFIKSSDLYKELLTRCEELEARLEVDG